MSVIDDVKQRLDIVELVSEYVKLQKSGRSYKALCPFHAEKHPSFFVFPERQSWHCFGACGTGGDIFSFIMKKDGLDFGQALRLLAERTGVTLVATSIVQKETEDKLSDRLFQINEAAAEYYHHLLLNASAGETARNYIAKRSLTPQTIEDFQLGFSLDSWETTKQHLVSKGYNETDMVTAGVLVEREGGDTYDRFRNRLMFPIRDIQGRVIGFGARALDESLPKYINSPQTPVFDKSNSLYGIDRAKAAIRQRDQAIIVEGYMDVIMTHQHGRKNIVASMGTAMTDRQLAIIKNLTRNLILALDADAAGEEAISRSGEFVDQMLALPELEYHSMGDDFYQNYDKIRSFEVKVFILPQGKDPDEVIKEDASIWQRLISDAKPLIDFIFEVGIAKIDLQNAKEKSNFGEKHLPLLSKIQDPVRRAHYMHRLAQLLKIDERDMVDTMRKFKASEKRRKVSKDTTKPTPLAPVFTSTKPAEEYCLALLIQYKALRPEGMKLSPDYFEYNENRELFLKWQQNSDNISLKNSLDPVLHEHLDSLLSKIFPQTLKDNEVEQQRCLNDSIIRLQQNFLRRLEARKEEILAIEGETGGVIAQLAKLEEQGMETSKQLKEIFAKQGHHQYTISRESEQ